MASSIPIPFITSPRFIVLRPKLLENSYVSYKDGHAVIEEEDVFSPLVKIEVESAEKVEGEKAFVHLRFCHSNRYLGRRDGSEIPVAEVMQPDEDMKKTTSTLFELRNIPGLPDKYYFCHMQSQTFPQLNEARNGLVIKGWRNTNQELMNFQLVDWDSLVKLPKHVAFKGDNDGYLKGHYFHSLNYLQFDSPDPNSEAVGHEVELLPNGYVKIKSLHFSGSYWRNSINWIWADSRDSSTTDKSLLFWPVKIDDNTIALRSALNNNFCKRLTADNKTSCLNAASSTISIESRLVVQELVLDRKIFNVRYRMEDARIFNENPFVAGTTSGVNESDRETSVSVSLGYKTTKSYSFSRSSTLTAGVTTTIETSVLEIVKNTIQFSFQVSESLEWGSTKTIEESITATGTVIVPPRSKAIVNYVGTVGTCNVPYSYRRQDKSSTDGKIVYSDEIDGVYTGVNAYNFSFQRISCCRLDGCIIAYASSLEWKWTSSSREMLGKETFRCVGDRSPTTCFWPVEADAIEVTSSRFMPANCQHVLLQLDGILVSWR